MALKRNYGCLSLARLKLAQPVAASKRANGWELLRFRLAVCRARKHLPRRRPAVLSPEQAAVNKLYVCLVVEIGD